VGWSTEGTNRDNLPVIWLSPITSDTVKTKPCIADADEPLGLRNAFIGFIVAGFCLLLSSWQHLRALSRCQFLVAAARIH
jgi:hypothetical protein